VPKARPARPGANYLEYYLIALLFLRQILTTGAVLARPAHRLAGGSGPGA